MLTVTIPDDDLATRLADLLAANADRLEFVPWQMWEPLPDAVGARVDVVAIGHYWRPRDWSLLAHLPSLKAVLLPSAGFEHAVPYIPPGVTLCNGRGVHSAGTAELAVGLAIASQRGLPDALAAQREGRWFNPILTPLADRKVAVVGAGSLADAVIARLEPFEVEIAVVARAPRTEQGRRVHGLDDLTRLLGWADIVILTVPLDDTTRHLIGASELAAMPDDALLINVARGGVVDTDALLVELESGRLRAALDVTDPEPLPPDHPLWRAPNTIITAHQGGNSEATYPRVARLVRRQIQHLLNGEPLENVVLL